MANERWTATIDTSLDHFDPLDRVTVKNRMIAVSTFRRSQLLRLVNGRAMAHTRHSWNKSIAWLIKKGSFAVCPLLDHVKRLSGSVKGIVPVRFTVLGIWTRLNAQQSCSPSFHRYRPERFLLLLDRPVACAIEMLSFFTRYIVPSHRRRLAAILLRKGHRRTSTSDEAARAT